MVDVELSNDPSEGPHRAETVADRPAYPANHEGTAYPVECHGDWFTLTGM